MAHIKGIGDAAYFLGKQANLLLVINIDVKDSPHFFSKR